MFLITKMTENIKWLGTIANISSAQWVARPPSAPSFPQGNKEYFILYMDLEKPKWSGEAEV